MLSFAALTPHAPIIIPEIGGEESKKVSKTIEAFLSLKELFCCADPETIIVISPHGLIYPDRPNIVTASRLFGDFSDFRAPQLKYDFENDKEFLEKLERVCQKENFPLASTTSRQDLWRLDHGTLVPLYFLLQGLSIKPKIISISYSLEPAAHQVLFGQYLFEAIQESDDKIALIASGDLSHRLITHPDSEKFDEFLIKALRKNKPEEIVNLDPDFAESAGECGWRSLLILLGALSSIKYKPEVLSYEGPFGVGYAVVNFKLK